LAQSGFYDPHLGYTWVATARNWVAIQYENDIDAVSAYTGEINADNERQLKALAGEGRGGAGACMYLFAINRTIVLNVVLRRELIVVSE